MFLPVSSVQTENWTVGEQLLFICFLLQKKRGGQCWMFAAVFVGALSGRSWCGEPSSGSLCYQETLQLALQGCAGTAGTAGSACPANTNQWLQSSILARLRWSSGALEGRRESFISGAAQLSTAALHTWHPHTPFTSHQPTPPAPAWMALIANLQSC